MRWRANAVGKCAGNQRRAAVSWRRLSAVGSRGAAVGCKLACVGCRAAVSWRASAVGRLEAGVGCRLSGGGCREAAMGRYPRGGLSGGCVRLRFFLLLVRACVLGCGRLRSASLLSSALIGLLAAIGFAPCPSLLWRRFLSGPLLLRIKAAPFKNPLAFAAFGRPVACLLAASLPVCGFGLRASLSVLACARFALSASSSCARLSCRPRLCAVGVPRETLAMFHVKRLQCST